MDVDDYTQPLESVMRQEQLAMYPVPLKLQDRQELFKLWCELNPRARRRLSECGSTYLRRGIQTASAQ